MVRSGCFRSDIRVAGGQGDGSTLKIQRHYDISIHDEQYPLQWEGRNGRRREDK